MSPIELARQSRMAANRAFLAGLNLPSSAMSRGEIKPLEKDDSLIVTAARELAKQATYMDAKQRVSPFSTQCLFFLTCPVYSHKTACRYLLINILHGTS